MSNFIPLPPTYAVTDPQVRAVLDVLSRNMQVVIDSGAVTSTNTTLTSVGGASSFGSGTSNTNVTNLAPSYTLDTLTADLKRGAAEVITGALNGTTVMKLEPAGQYVVFQHKDASVLGTVGAYAGTVRTALGITSTGILGGYNRQSDGAWQTTFAIESATGNLTLLGTIRAASVISVSAYLGTTLVSDVVNNAAAVTTKLNKSAADILSGTIEFQSAGGFKTGTIAVDSSGNATGAGVAITSKGIVGRNVSNTTFTIDATTGAATFAGALTAATGSFVGTVAAGAIIADSVTLNSAGGTSLSIIAGQASGALPSASFGTTLQSSLNSGVTNILAGTGSNYRLKVDASLAFIAFQHKDAVYNGTATAGLGILPAVGISAAGIAMGYNDNTGAWNNAVSLSATGDLTVKGTITAGSIIVGSVTIGAGGTTLTAVEGNASTALSTANTANTNASNALTAVTTKLNKSAADILSGTIDFQNAGGFKTGTIAIDGSGNATGAGVAFTSKGIVGRNVGATTFTIDATTGAATFAGALIAASGSFVGTVAAGGIIADSVTLNSAGGTSLSIIAGQASGALPSASFGTTLQSSLNSGVTNILAGTGSNYRLKVDATNAFIAFQHKDAVYNGTATAGLGILPAVGISAAGIAMGYNDNTGTWNNAVSLSATGNLTVKGTITAGSIIVGSVTIGAGGTTLSAVETNSSNAISLATTADANASSALTQVTNKLNKNASDILSGGITFSSAGGFKTGTISIDSSGNATGDGVAFTSKGIVGRTSAGTTFTLDATTGAATFKGDITGASGTFTGTVQSASSGNRVILNESSSSYIRVYDGSGGTIFSLLGVSGLYANSTINGASAIGALTVTNASGYNGNAITATNYGSGHGIMADAQSTGTTRNGVLAYSAGTGSGAAAVYAVSNGGSFGMYCSGRFGISDSTVVTNLNANYLQGYTASSFMLTGSTASDSNALGGYSASSWARIFATNSGNANAGGSGINLLGSTSTGIAGAYVGTSGTSNIVTFTVQTTSPSDVRLKEEIANIDVGLAFVNQLRPVSYKLKADPRHQKGYGFIADEVELLGVYGSSLVYEEPDWQVGDQIGFKTIHYPSYVAVLTKAIQELSAKVTALESANAT